MENEQSLREQLTQLLHAGHAHASFDDTVAGLAPKLQGAKPDGAPYSPWQLLEHLRLGQWDILEFSRDPKHVSPKWPEGYWPATQSPPDDKAWDQSVEAFRRDLKAFEDLLADPQNDLFEPFPHGKGQTLLREALLLADHNSYHLGQIVLVRRLLGAWPG
ncbi:MAG TPA: DinB family protein [Thermoanaerobaculia bacterium]|nr:DinB family protein [Thermoanaerobaculia bacterium]